MPEHVFDCRGPDETERLARKLAAIHHEAPAIYLLGELGAGKTTFTKGLAEFFGISPSHVVSPTFSLVNRYGDGRRVIYHLDLYRIDVAGELDELGIEEMEEEGALLVVEWPEKLGRYWRPDATLILLERVRESGVDDGEAPEQLRRVRVSPAGPEAPTPIEETT